MARRDIILTPDGTEFVEVDTTLYVRSDRDGAEARPARRGDGRRKREDGDGGSAKKRLLPLALVGLIGAAVVPNIPDLKRYLKIRSM